MHSEDELVALSALSHYVFCPRRAALLHLENLWQENVATAEGHLLHDRVHEQGTESRGELRMARGVHLRSLELGLYGVADVVEFHRVSDGENGAALPHARGRWRPFPVEYKRGIKRHEQSFAVQLCAQALCLEEMLGTSVPAGALYYGLSRRRHDVVFDQALRCATREAARGLHALIAAGNTPPAEHGQKCKRCSLNELCMPRLAGGRSAVAYVAMMTAAGEETDPPG